VFGRRSDATLAQGLSRTQRFMPFISPRRNDSLVYYTTEIEIDAALRFVDEQNARREGRPKLTLFHLCLFSIARAFHDRPGVNRFVAGGRTWQRDGVYVTFSAKQEMLDGAPVLTVKRRFPEDEDLLSMVDTLLEELLARRRGKETTSDKEMSLALRLLPGFGIRFVLWALDRIHHLGLMPRAMIENDPMFSSIFVANLGSVGLDAGYHHLWEYGTCSIFAVIGRIKERHGKKVVEIRYSYDERIADGLYAAISLGGIKERLEHPERLLAPEEGRAGG